MAEVLSPIVNREKLRYSLGREGSGNYSNHQRQTAGVSITPKAVMQSNSHVMTPGSL